MRFTDAEKGEMSKNLITPAILNRFSESVTPAQLDALHKVTGLSCEINDGRIDRAYYEQEGQHVKN